MAIILFGRHRDGGCGIAPRNRGSSTKDDFFRTRVSRRGPVAKLGQTQLQRSAASARPSSTTLTGPTKETTVSPNQILVSAENYARAESARMFTAFTARAEGSNRWNHGRQPTPIDAQTVIRMNRDTLYSANVLDVSQGATITVPDAGGRYVSVMLVSEEHYIERILHEPGTYELTAEQLGSEFVLAAARVLVDPQSPTTSRRSRPCRMRSARRRLPVASTWHQTSIRCPSNRQPTRSRCSAEA
ncbi:DUF1254 domain-containing protein [Gulosibacter faecalis]|uniref:DUF1254 domain-containing protein n=1 Tax=Gulosibacter faecalis TaxID=272240 RepID=UPI001F190362|nr:DUF1254 domain-containing protein [Gulosibacter faecalis]